MAFHVHVFCFFDKLSMAWIPEKNHKNPEWAYNYVVAYQMMTSSQ